MDWISGESPICSVLLGQICQKPAWFLFIFLNTKGFFFDFFDLSSFLNHGLDVLFIFLNTQGFYFFDGLNVSSFPYDGLDALGLGSMITSCSIKKGFQQLLHLGGEVTSKL